MPDVAKLKKRAAEFELKKQFDKALATYVQILDSYGPNSEEEVDLSLFNRVGDLYLKQGNVADAVDYYEQAVDRYADGGFFNNAIALCNKILRNSPGRATVYYKLGKISAQKGFKSDAKANFLEYADRMQQAGRIDESFRALKEFADLCPDQDDIRLMLADQLTKKGRGPEAVEQLQMLYERYSQEGRDTEARATIERMKAIDPTSEPRARDDTPLRAVGDLVFLDLGDAAPPPPRGSTARRATAGLDIIATGDHEEVRPAAPVRDPVRVPPPAPVAQPEPIAPAFELAPEQLPEPEAGLEPDFEMELVPGVELDDAPIEAIELQMYEPAVLDGLTRSVDFERGIDPGNSPSLLDGLDTTGFVAPADSSDHGLLDFEPTDFGTTAPAPVDAVPESSLADDLLGFEMPEARVSGPREIAPREILHADPPRPGTPARPSFHDLPMLDDGPAPSDELVEFDDEPTIGGNLELIMPDAEVDELPLMDLDLPMPGEATASIMGTPVGTPAVPAVSELETIDFSPAVVAPDAVPVFEMSPVELDLRAELELDDAGAMTGNDVPTLDLGGTGEFDQVSDERDSTGDFDLIPAPARRSSTMLAAQSVEVLQAAVNADPIDGALRRQLGEAMLESGDREGGVRELEAAMVAYERADDLSSAASLADEIVLLNPGSLRHLQKRVEYAFRTSDRTRLIDAYLQLADALLRAEQVDKARAIYQRVLDLSPDDLRANAALQSFPVAEPEPAPAPEPKGRLSTAMPRVAPAAARPMATRDDEFVNLGDWLRDDEAPKDTRMIVDEKEPTGDEEADFQDMLRKFKQGIAENVEEEDHQSHYDLGVAYKEMGLLDEAIAEFQKALRAPANRVSTYEALGQCFIEKEQFPMASTILSRALHEKDVHDDQLIGVLYLLGLCAEQRGQKEQALQFYQRVFVLDIQFKDIGDRLAAVEGYA